MNRARNFLSKGLILHLKAINMHLRKEKKFTKMWGALRERAQQ